MTSSTRDVAQGLIAAAEKGRPGEGYILSGRWATVGDLLQTIARVTNVPGPRLCLPLGLAKAVSFLMPAYYGIRRERPRFTTYSLHVISSNSLMSHEKAERELDFSPRPFAETVRDTVEWFRQRERATDFVSKEHAT